MKENILQNHGPLCTLYKSHENGDFRSEGDSPAFMHAIPTGLRNLESPGWGGWGGRYTKVRENTWLDPVVDPAYQYPDGRWYGNSAWGRERLREDNANDKELTVYLKPIWRWTEAFQNDFASRADWCMKSYKEANHPPIPKLNHDQQLTAKVGERVDLSAEGSIDPDGDNLSFKWFYYPESGPSIISSGRTGNPLRIENTDKANASFIVPRGSRLGTMHIILAVTDQGTPALTRYKRVIITINP